MTVALLKCTQIPTPPLTSGGNRGIHNNGDADPQKTRHLRQVPLHGVEIKQQRGRINFVQFHVRGSAGLELWLVPPPID